MKFPEPDRRCDRDGDNVYDGKDNCPGVCNPDQRDKDKDGNGDACQLQDGYEKVCTKKRRAAK